MNFFFPKFGALCMAENCTCHLHNLYTPRGAQVRDAKAWSFYIDEALALFGADTRVMFASHHWPRWDAGPVRRLCLHPQSHSGSGLHSSGHRANDTT